MFYSEYSIFVLALSTFPSGQHSHRCHVICKEGGKESLEVTNASEVSNENKKSKKCSQKGIVKVSQYTFVCEKKKNKNTKGNENRRDGLKNP